MTRSALAFRRHQISSAFNPLTAIAWHSAYWADDPGWTNPGNGNAVSSWNDGSGNGHTATQAAGGKQPLFRSSVSVLNNKAGVEFDGIDDLLSSSSFTTVAQTISAVVVFRRVATGGTNNPRIFDFQGSSSPFTSVLVDSGTAKFALYAGSAFLDDGADSTGGHAIRGKFNGASSAINTDGTNATGNPGTGGAVMVNLGGASGQGFANVAIGFAGLYNGDITAAGNWTAFKSWVSTNYGLTLA